MVDIDTLVNFNRWWTTGKVPEVYLGKFERPLLKKIQKYLPSRQIVLIYGLRRVGKTTLFYQLIQSLLQKKIEPTYFLYFSFDEKKAELKEIVKTYQEKVLKKDLLSLKRVYLFFDEIQKLDNWQEKIKLLYDQYPNIKIFLSGSASVALQKKSQESLAGRLFDFFLKPLDFGEFLDWRGVKVDKNHLELFQSQIMPYFLDYLRKGGFPEIVGQENDEIIKNYLKNTVLERIIYKDLPEEFGLKDIELLRTLIEMVCRQPGMIINFDSLSQDLGRSKVTLMNYFAYLKYALIVRELKNLRPGFLVSSRKRKKIYPTTSAFCFAYQDNFYQEGVLQKIAEVAVVNQTQANHYFRNAYEVDVILKRKNQVLPIEVKYGKVETKSILRFLTQFNLRKGVVVSKDFYQKKGNLLITPLWRFLLENSF